MADFYQTGVVTTLHRLRDNDISRLEGELQRFSENTAIGLVLPALYSEFESPAMQGILAELSRVTYLRQIVLALARADLRQYSQVKKLLRGLPGHVTVLWIDGERMQILFRLLEKHWALCRSGRQRKILLVSLWLSPGYP